MLHEYGFVHPRPPPMPKNKEGFIIATYEGVKVDWPVIIADCLQAAIKSVQDSKKVWTVVAQRHPPGAIGGASKDKEAGPNNRDYANKSSTR